MDNIFVVQSTGFGKTVGASQALNRPLKTGSAVNKKSAKDRRKHSKYCHSKFDSGNHDYWANEALNTNGKPQAGAT